MSDHKLKGKELHVPIHTHEEIRKYVVIIEPTFLSECAKDHVFENATTTINLYIHTVHPPKLYSHYSLKKRDIYL